MAETKPLPVKTPKIDSVDIPRFDGGLFLNGEQDAPSNAITASKDVELDKNGFMIPRRVQTPFLPDTVETTYQKFPVLWNDVIYYFTADDGKIRYCQEGDADWSDCTGTNSITTNNGGMPELDRVLNNVVLCNGTNGDKLCYVDLETPGFPVVKFSLVTDPPTVLSSTLAGLTTGALNIYYAFSYSGAAGETKLSPILTQSLNIARDQWQSLGTPGTIKLTRPGSPPAGALFWNVYIAIAATGGAIAESDMLQIAMQLDLASTTFTDDGSLSINLGSVAPLDNGTDGPLVDHVLVEDGNPIYYGDVVNPYAIHIGGGGPNAMSLSVSQGGYEAEPEKGTNYYAAAVIGFRTGQGIPALTIFYSNTEGTSKQAVLQQQTVNYGDQSFTVWGVTEQHYGAAGVAAPNSAINSNGKLMFLSTNGFLSAQTQPSVQNIIAILPISAPIEEYVRTIKNSAMKTVVGTAWDNKYMWLTPGNGFNTPKQITILDTNNKGVDGDGAWDIIDIEANWIGVVSPQDDPAFVYISRGNKTYKLLIGNTTVDTIDGVKVPFSTNATGAMAGLGGTAHNEWMAVVQTMFYVVGLIGEITLGVRYRNQNGKIKFKEKRYQGPEYVPSTAGGWGDPGWTWDAATPSPAWSGVPAIDDTGSGAEALDVRIPVRVDDISNEAQWYYRTPAGYNNYKVKVISHEGIALGVRPDLQ